MELPAKVSPLMVSLDAPRTGRVGASLVVRIHIKNNEKVGNNPLLLLPLSLPAASLCLLAPPYIPTDASHHQQQQQQQQQQQRQHCLLLMCLLIASVAGGRRDLSLGLLGV